MFERNIAYEASAGSGKTFMLVVRYLSLLFLDADPSKIVALTFTNKSATEMSERIVETLEELESRDELQLIAQQTALTPEQILQKRAYILAKFLAANTKIVTIDSFFTQILRKFSLYGSLMPDFSTHNAQHEVKLMTRFLQEVDVAQHNKTLINLSLASKKRFSDIFYLLDELYLKREELSHIKFQPQNLAVIEQSVWSEFHALASLVAQCSSASATLKKQLQAESFEDIVKKSWLERETLEYRTFAKCFTPKMNEHLYAIQDGVKHYFQAKEQNFFYGLFELVELYVKSKKALYKDEAELSFADVSMLVYEILKKIDDSEFLYFRLDANIEHILLDEFQDTSILQYEILKPLIDEVTSGTGVFEGSSFFFVGDVKQSIYRFRGGVSALFGEVAKAHNTKIEKLLVNYRSKEQVVSFVNDTFLNKIEGYTPQLVRDGADGGYVEVVQSDEVVTKSVEIIQELLQMGAKADDIAILCATNGDGEVIKEALLEQNIEVVTETTTKLINQRSIKALIEYLKYIYFGEEIYRYNFFALIEQEVAPIVALDCNSVSLQKLVKSVVEEYKIFSDEFHILRFLDALESYSDIEAFLFEYERLDVGAPSSDSSGVRVLTIHKSKGLEYKHVVVMDRLKNPPPPRDSIIYDYDGIRLQNIYLRTSKRESLDRSYAHALHKEQQLQREDRLNALYVAFTRAREHLFIVQKSEKSLFEIVELSTQKQGRVSIVQPVQKSDATQKKVFEYESKHYGTQSDIVAFEAKTQEELEAITFGLAMHYMLEMMADFSTQSIADAKSMMLNKYGLHLDNSMVVDIEQRVKRLVEDHNFLALLDTKYYKEKALYYKKELRYIDLLVECEDGSYNIIDYKSSKNNAQEHIKQVRTYIDAVRLITQSDVNGYLCYLLEESVEIEKI